MAPPALLFPTLIRYLETSLRAPLIHGPNCTVAYLYGRTAGVPFFSQIGGCVDSTRGLRLLTLTLECILPSTQSLRIGRNTEISLYNPSLSKESKVKITK